MFTANRVDRCIGFGLPQKTDNLFGAMLFLFHESTPCRLRNSLVRHGPNQVGHAKRRVAVGSQCATVDDVLPWLSIDVGLGAIAAVSAVLSGISAAKKCRPNVVGASQADFCRMD